METRAFQINKYQVRTTTHKADYKKNPLSGSAGGIPSRNRKNNYRFNLSPLNRPW